MVLYNNALFSYRGGRGRSQRGLFLYCHPFQRFHSEASRWKPSFETSYTTFGFLFRARDRKLTLQYFFCCCISHKISFLSIDSLASWKSKDAGRYGLRGQVSKRLSRWKPGYSGPCELVRGRPSSLELEASNCRVFFYI